LTSTPMPSSCAIKSRANRLQQALVFSAPALRCRVDTEVWMPKRFLSHCRRRLGSPLLECRDRSQRSFLEVTLEA
jgi:hypothetical protein